MKQPVLLSILVTAYNAQNTVQRALQSTHSYREDYEVLVCDDCSADATAARIAAAAKTHPALRVLTTPENSGGPSLPRNLCIEAAQGEFIAFLDDDDLVDMDELFSMAEYAREKGLDALKGYLKIYEGGVLKEANRLYNAKKEGIYSQIIAGQSTTVDILLRRSFLLAHNIRFPQGQKLGEDTVFYTALFRHEPVTEYTDRCYYTYCKDTDSANRSTTQRYGDNELGQHMSAWRQAEENLRAIGLSYYALRLPVALKNTLVSLVRYGYGNISAPAFSALCAFIKEQQGNIGKISLDKRYQPVWEALLAEDFSAFTQAIKPRLLIAGMDLKFILPIVPFLREHYLVEIDEWEGHQLFNETRSKKLLEWADIIFCEWLLGNAVWYSSYKLPRQSLLIRAHRFEASRDFGFDVNWSNVDALITVSVYFFELFARTFSVPREKMRLLSNYVQPEQYVSQKEDGWRKHLALAGMLPKTKGYLRALELLYILRQKDPAFALYLIGKQPHEVSWIVNQEDEKEYFAQCDRFIAQNNLGEHVHVTGWRERRDIYRESGFVLSVSDPELPESFHLAPAEGITDGCIGLLLAWPGAEYIYPREMLCASLEEMAEKIYRLSEQSEEFDAMQGRLRQYIISQYPADKICTQLYNILQGTHTAK